MKRPLYYAIRTGSLYNPVIAVTSEKKHRWHGRDVNGHMPTHGVLTDLSGRFETVEEAVLKREAISKLADSYDEGRRVLARESDKLYRLEREAMARLIAGDDPGPVPQPVVSYDGSAVALNDNGWHMPSLNEGLRLARVCNGTPMPGDIEAGEGNSGPTDDAWISACRAIDWRTAELRFHGHEPISIPPDAPRYPPDDFDFSNPGGQT
jgi:hypothetical protein